MDLFHLSQFVRVSHNTVTYNLHPFLLICFFWKFLTYFVYFFFPFLIYVTIFYVNTRLPYLILNCKIIHYEINNVSSLLEVCSPVDNMCTLIYINLTNDIFIFWILKGINIFDVWKVCHAIYLIQKVRKNFINSILTYWFFVHFWLFWYLYVLNKVTF